MNPYNWQRYLKVTTGLEPCTHAAVIGNHQVLWYKPPRGDVAVIGRSLVVGKPMSMMLIKENDTVTICHSRTKDIKSIVSRADIVVAALGKARAIGTDYIKPGAVVIDVGSQLAPEGGICGMLTLTRRRVLHQK
jgi:methylenetetrahydrofolate dehydrogenase (NADP+)/methenyltetrahydrofolate cyclohydrolase